MSLDNTEDLPLNLKIQTYDQDGRKPIEELWAKYEKLVESGLFRKELIYIQKGTTLDGKRVDIPTFGYISIDKPGDPKPSFWIIGGIHGEEPAGPNALADNVDDFIEMVRSGMSMVLVPLMNGVGYIKDDRYFDAHRMGGSSVSDMDHLLGKTENPNNYYTQHMGEWVQKTTDTHSPLLVVDHHEDDINHDLSVIDAHVSYCYVYGTNLTLIKKISILLTQTLKNSGFPVQENGVTRFSEKITNGFITNSLDGSVDQLLAEKYGATSFVIETTRDDDKNIPLPDRIKAHTDIINLYRQFWEEISRSSN
jgi:hypothetical protein